MALPRAGEPAPEFTLPGTGGRDYSLASYRGSPVILAFYPGDDTPVCTRQLTAYTEDFVAIESVGAALLGISPQDVDSHEAFSSRHGGFAFPLLADTDQHVARAYGVLGPLGFYKRSVFVVDGEGVCRYAHRSRTGASFKTTGELVEAVRAAS